jgi:hypothetical protein
MLQGLSIPIVAKFCAAALVVGGAGVATYEVVDMGGDDAATVSSDSPDALAFAEDGDKEKKEGTPLDVDDPTNPKWQTDRKESAEDDADALTDAEEEEAEAKAREAEEKERAAEEARKKAEAEAEIDNETYIEILWPEPDSHWEDRVVVFEGEAEPGSQVYAGRYEADINDDGAWRIELILSPGANKAVLKAVDAAGNIAEDDITVWLDVEEPKEEPKAEPKEEPKEEPEEAVEVEFSANQKYGECDAEVPYDVFWGTATPHTVVHISSEYGSASVEVGKKGHWEKKVWFEQAPRGVEFPVYIDADNGEKIFWFYAIPFAEEVPDEELPPAGDGHEGDGHEGEETL